MPTRCIAAPYQHLAGLDGLRAQQPHDVGDFLGAKLREQRHARQHAPGDDEIAPVNFFGEIALLRRANRSGTVTATRKTRLLALDAQDFHALIARVPALAAHIEQTAKARLASTAGIPSGDIASEEIALAKSDADDDARRE